MLLEILFSLVINEMFKYKEVNLKVDNVNFYLSSFNSEIPKIFIQNEIWSLSIPNINLNNVQIEDSVDSLSLENYIGHFPITGILTGNICLAAHNAGYTNCYFKDIDKLKHGDKVYYRLNNMEKIFYVDEILKIKDNDFSFLEASSKDCLNLITCISFSPNYRLCVKCVGEEEFNGKNI